MNGLARTSQTTESFASELRISPRPVMLFLTALGWVLVMLTFPPPDAPTQARVQLFALVVYVGSGSALLLDTWKPRVGRWVLVVVLASAIHLGHDSLALPGFLSLIAIPTGLAVATISPAAGAAVAVGETLLLTLLPGRVAAGGNLSAIFAPLMSAWATLGLMYAVHRPVRQLGEWLGVYFQRAQDFLEQARDRKAELEQTLEDLANANRQLAMANERIATLRMIAEEAQKTKIMFVSKVSHEFRTPLNMIIGLVGLIVDRPPIEGESVPPHLMEDLRVVYRNCQHLTSMIDDVLDLSQADGGRLSMHRERVDLGEIVYEALAVVRPLIVEKDIALHLAVPGDLPAVYCDRTRIRQVILNLVSNAARFTDQGQIGVHIEQQNRHIQVSVEDTGPGIPPQDLQGIFEPFCQGSGSIWRDRGGSGLGLTISREFVRLHGGRMWVDSELGVGSRFIFDLPISPAIEHVARADRWIREDWVWREGAFRTDRAGMAGEPVKPRIVICDETGDLYSEFSRYTDEVEFVDVRSAVQATREAEKHLADAVLINSESVEHLWSLVEEVRRETPHTPVIGCSVPRSIKRALEGGAVDYLIKPVTIEDLKGAVNSVGRPVRRVLVVDDDPEVLQLFTRMLHVCDRTLEVATASDGEHALDMMRGNALDLVLLDVVLPDMDGWRVLERMSSADGVGNTPVVFVSGQDPSEQPLASPLLVATLGGGLSLSQVVRCSLGLPTLLAERSPQPDRAPV